MRVHHLNCGTLRPAGGRLVSGEGGVLRRARALMHCLLIETSRELVLVETGLGARDLADPVGRLGRPFLALAGPRLDPDEAAVRQVARLGHAPEDVRDIVLTHLDLDHAGGLPDFPPARVHVSGAERAGALALATRTDRRRYRAHLWAHGPTWAPEPPPSETWFGITGARRVVGPDAEILLVPLPGHSHGHCGVAVRTASGWLLHAGDAYFHRREMDPERPRCPLGWRLFQRAIQVDADARLASQAALRRLVREHATEVRIFCAHDPVEFDGRSADPEAAPGGAPGFR